MKKIELSNVSYTYPDGTKALKNISFSLAPKSKNFFHGLNGAGKTTLFQCMNGLIKPNQGEILLDGKICHPKELMKRVGIVFQNAEDQMIAGSVYEEISFGLFNLGFSEEEVKAKTQETLQQFDLEALKDKPPHFLSYGQKKRVSIASIYAMAPEVIIFDEPTANLDFKQTERVVHIFDELCEKGITVIVATHDIDLSWMCADYLVGIYDGAVFKEGLPEKLFLEKNFLNAMQIPCPVILDIYRKSKDRDDTKPYPRTRQALINILKEGN